MCSSLCSRSGRCSIRVCFVGWDDVPACDTVFSPFPVCFFAGETVFTFATDFSFLEFSFPAEASCLSASSMKSIKLPKILPPVCTFLVLEFVLPARVFPLSLCVTGGCFPLFCRCAFCSFALLLFCTLSYTVIAIKIIIPSHSIGHHLFFICCRIRCRGNVIPHRSICLHV